MAPSPRHLVRAAREHLDPATTLALVLRLLLARRLELQCRRSEEEVEETHAGELSLLRGAERDHRLRALLRERLRALPRRDDSFERLARLEEPERTAACVAYLRDFSGSLGERLRDPGTLEALERLGASGALGPLLARLLELGLAPGELDDAGFAALERSVLSQLAGAGERELLEAAFARYRGLATEALGPGELRVESEAVAVQVEHSRRVNWAMERNGIPLVHSVRLENRSERELTGLTLSLQIGPDFSERFERPVDSIPPGATYNIERPDLELDGLRLRGLREGERGALHVELRRGVEVLVRESRPVAVLAFNEWDRTALPELLAAFVLPNDPAVAQVLESARDVLQETTGDPALDGYQRRSRSRVRAVLEAVYEALQRLAITYVSPPASFEPTGQKLRFPGDVLEHRMGTCVDITVLAAACLEHCGLHPLIALEKEHAFPGCWLVEDWMPLGATDDQHTVRKLAAAEELLFFDVASATRRPPLCFADAEAAARASLERDGTLECLVDVKAARLARILPLPIRDRGVPAPAAPGEETPAAGDETAAGRTGAGDLSGAREPPGAAGRAVPPPRGLARSRVDAWKDQLLDLTLRNRLLNFRESRSRSVALDLPELDLLEDRLASGKLLDLHPQIEIDQEDPRAAELLETRGAEKLLREQRLDLLRRGHVITRHRENDLERRLRLIFRAARTETEETGASTLYLAVGMLRWFESEGSDTPRLAPILLYPVELSRPSARSPFRLRQRDDEPRINDTLVEKLKRDFGLDFEDLRNLPLDEAGVDVKEVMSAFRRGVARVRRFEVLDEAHVAFFSFNKFLLWRDLNEHQDELLENDLVRLLVTGEGSEGLRGGGFLAPGDIGPEGLRASRLVLDADSSQHGAVAAALEGRTFVLQGPPGTGKSQTIANIIGECLAAGKRVLFVAEKRAALEVVARRLRAVGLGDFCLELHSNKASKREVVLELARVYELGPGGGDPPRDTLPERIERDASRLDAYVGRIHEPAPVGLSWFQCLGRYLERQGAAEVAIEFPEILATEARTHEQRLEALEWLAAAAEDLPLLVGHPLREIGLGEWTALRAREWERILEELAAATARLRDLEARSRSALGVERDVPVAALAALGRLLELLAGGVPEGARELLERGDAAAAAARLGSACSMAGERRDLLERLDARWERDLLALDLERLHSRYRRHARSFFLWRWLVLRRARKELRAVAREKLPRPEEIAEDLCRARRARELEGALEAEQPFLAELLGAGACGAATDFEAAGRLASFAEGWRRAVESLEAQAPQETALLPDPRRSGAARGLDEELSSALVEYRERQERALRELAVDRERAFGGSPEEVTLEAVAALAERWRGAFPGLRAWTRYVAAERRLEELGLAPLARALRAGELEPRHAAAAFELGFFRSWLEHSLEESGELRIFSGREHERVIRTFRRNDAQFIELNGTHVAALLARRRPAAGAPVAESSEVGLLLREARKKTRHLPIRRLLERLPHLLPRLKPCLLMSPLSIAQYLPPWTDPFDLVIFDEASQITTCDAIGAIARGKQVVVVGDSKQLPPTSFFQASLDEGDETDAPQPELVAELESILDECVASNVPSLMLRWHYRSRDERLIAFSNWHYYENRLQTFPAAAIGEATGLSLVRLEGVFDRGASRTNRAEAVAVARWITGALLDPECRHRSLGVVTFNQPQQMLVEDLLDEARRQHPEIEPYFDNRAPEPVFVKNLENVQGDERDVILFSVTYGFDARGKMAMNFGPLNQQGGERRLNVAITRARERLVVFASIGAEAIDLARTQALGVVHLKSFLRYAERGPEVFAEKAVRGGEGGGSAFEEDVKRRFAARGHAVECRVGCSDYRVDLAVRDPAAPERFLLALEGDGENYRTGATARDRDRLRQAVLERLGWTVERVWSVDWFLDREGELERLEKALAAARRRGGAGLPPGANAELASSRGGDDEEAAEAAAGAGTDRGGEPEEEEDREGAGEAGGGRAAGSGGLESRGGESEGQRPAGAGGMVARSGSATHAGRGPSDRGREASASAGGEVREGGRTEGGDTARGEPGAGGEGAGGTVAGPPAGALPGGGEAPVRGAGSGEAAGGLLPFVPFRPLEIGPPEDFYDPAQDGALVELAGEIAAVEGPLDLEELGRRVIACYGLGRVGPAIRERLENLVAAAERQGKLRTRGGFAWPPGMDPDRYRLVRGPDARGEVRRVGQVALEERAAAVERVLRSGVAFSREDLARAGAEFMGYRRLTDSIRGAFDEAIDFLLAAGRAVQEGETVRVP